MFNNENDFSAANDLKLVSNKDNKDIARFANVANGLLVYLFSFKFSLCVAIRD